MVGLYKIVYDQVVVKQHIPALPKTMRERIETAIEKRLAVDPISYGKPMHHSLSGHRRIRVGDYRIIYRVDMPNWKIIIIGIGHRKDIYEQ